jgi:hypothetical protein
VTVTPHDTPKPRRSHQSARPLSLAFNLCCLPGDSFPVLSGAGPIYLAPDTKPVCPNMATATPLGPPGAQTAQKQHAGLLELDAQPASVFPRARHGRSLPRCGELTFRTPARHRAPNREPGRILVPGDGAAGDQEAQNRPACPATAATLRPQAHMPSCNRQVTSTWIHMAKPGPASAPRGHAPLYTDTLSLARTISADFVRDDDQVPWLTDVYRSSSSAYRGCPADASGGLAVQAYGSHKLRERSARPSAYKKGIRKTPDVAPLPNLATWDASRQSCQGLHQRQWPGHGYS